MANTYMGNMTFGVGFKVDTTALDKLDAQFSNILQDITRFTNKATSSKDNGLQKQAQQAKVAYDQLYEAMKKAYNSKLGQFDLTKVNSNLKSMGTSLSSVVKDLNNAGQNVNGIISTLGSNKLMIKQTNQFLDKMAVTFGNTVRWQITNKIINTVTGSIQKAFYFTKDLDQSLNDIRIVTSKSADEMARFAVQATNAAQALGRTTTDYTKASLLFYQQGLSDKEVAARTETTLKTANVTGQSTSEVSEQLTAVWNGYRVTAAETEKYVDKLSAVAASTASNLEELSTGMSKVASAANMMGVDIDQLNAQLSTVISVTRQAPETIGAAFKTIYSRMSTIKAGGIDEEDGATLTSYSEKMNQFGFSVLDANGNLRDMGEVIEEIGSKWEDLTREQQVGLAQAMGGTRQYSNLTALFENWDKYQAALKTSQNATGTLQKQQDIYMDSVAAHFEQLTTEAEKFYEALLDEDALKDVADGLKFLVQEINAMIKGLGGGKNTLLQFGATLTNLFSNKIGSSIGAFENTRAQYAEERKKIKATQDINRAMAKGDIKDTTPTTYEEIKDDKGLVKQSLAVATERANQQEELLKVSSQLGQAEYNRLTAANEKLAVLKTEREQYDLISKDIEQEGYSVEEVIKSLDKMEQISERGLEMQNAKIKGLELEKKGLDDQLAVLTKLKELGYTGKNADVATTNTNSAIATQQQRIQDKNNQIMEAEVRKASLEKIQNISGNYKMTAQDKVDFQALFDYYKDKQGFQGTAGLNALKNAIGHGNIKNQQGMAIKQLFGSEITNTDTEIEGYKKELIDLTDKANLLSKALEELTNHVLVKKNGDIDRVIGNMTDESDTLEEAIKEEQKSYKINERYQSRADIISNNADKAARDQKDNERAALEEELQKGEEAGKRQRNWTKTIQGLSGAVRAANALFGGLNVAMDNSKSALERVNGGWEAVTGSITGGISAINPMVGMLVSGVFSLGKSILDATGLTAQFAERFKDATEKMNDLRQKVKDTTASLQTATQELSEINQQTQEFHSNIKGLEGLKESWDQINAKMQAGIDLTDEEKKQYQSMAEQILSMNQNITYTYDEQHNLIISNNDALDDTITKLKEEYEIRKKIDAKTARDNAKRAMDDAKKAKEEYEAAIEEQRKNEQAIDSMKDYYTKIASFLAEGNLSNIYHTTGQDKLDLATQTRVGEMQKYFALDENGEIDQSAWKRFLEKLAEDPDNAVQKFNEEFDLMAKASVEAGKSSYWDTPYDTGMDLISGIGAGIEHIGTVATDNLANMFQDDIDNLFEEMKKELALPQLASIITGIDDSILSESDKAIKEALEQYAQNFTIDFTDRIEPISSATVEKLVTSRAESQLKTAITEQGEDFDYEETMQKIVQEGNKFAIDLSKCSDALEKATKEIGELKLKKTQISAQEYVNAVQNTLNELERNAKANGVELTTEDLDLIFGKGNYGDTLINKFEGANIYHAYGMTPGTGGAVGIDYKTLAQKYFGAGTWDQIQSSELNIEDFNKIEDFLKTLFQGKDYSKYGSDWLTQFEGYNYEKYGGKIFADYAGEIGQDLDTLKKNALEGQDLDEETFEKVNQQLAKYKDQLKDVAAERDILTEKDLYGTQVWYESLQRVEKELEKAYSNKLYEDRAQLEFKVNLDTQDATQDIQKFTEKDYEIIVHLDTEGEDTYQTAIKEIENMQKSLSYVGEEGKIAAENVYEFLNAFPEMNDMIKELNSDGSISLTKEQIQLVRERSEANITAILAEREIELKADLDRMQAEKDRIENQKTLIKEELSNWGQKEFNKEQFVKNFTEFYGDSADTQLKITETDNDYMNDDTYDTSVAIAKYWDEASTKAAESYRAFAESVIQNNSAIENNNKADLMHAVTAGSGIDKIDYESQKTQTEELLNDIQNLGNESIDQQKALLEQMLASLDKEGDLIDSSIEKQQNRMIALNAQGLAAIKNAGDLGKKTKEAAWEAKHLYDYYHDVNKELDFINQKLTVLQKKQKLLEGSALLKNLKLQSKEYENQIKYLQQKRGIQEGYQQELQTRQKDELGNKGLAAYGITFDKNGYIENYAEIAKKLQEGQHDKESVEDYQNFINQVKTYEENLKLVLDLEGQLYDVVAKRQELQSKAVEERVKMILDVSEARKKYMEFTKELGNWKVNLIINPDQTAVDAATAKAAESFVEDSITAMEKSARMVKKGNSAIDRLKAGDFDVDKKGNKTDYVKFNGQKYKMEDLLKLEEDVDKFADAASQSAADIQQAYQNTLDAYSNAMKELNDWDKRVLARYDMINGVYDHAEKLTELWYGKDSLEAKIMLTSTQQQKTDNLYAKAKEANDQVKKDWEIYQDAFSTGNEKLAEEAYDAWAESMQNLQSLTEQFAEERKKQLQNELELAAKIVETQIYGGKTREEFTNTWELINKQAETYLDTINAQFGVTQLENKYLQAINKTVGNSKAQEKLNKIMSEEMAMLKEKDKLTKYDLERAEAKYDLTLKQIALEEARENKTNLRLRRDSQGNYTYQYAANEADVLQAQSDLDAAKNNLYNMDRDRYQELTQQAIDTEAEYYQKLSEIQTKFGDDEEARLAAESELYDAYFGDNGILTGILAERAVAYENLNESIVDSITGTGSGTILGSFEQLATDLPAKISELAPALDESIQGIVDLWTDPETGVASAYTTLQSETEEFYKKYQADLAQFASDIDGDTTFGKIRTTFGTVKDAVDEFEKAAGLANTAIGSLNDTSSKFSLDALVTDFGTLITDLGGADDENGLIWRINEANTKLTELVNPEEKVNNFKKIRNSLASIRTTLDKNKERFDTALTEIKDWKEAVVGYAQDAETEIGKVANALDSLKDKTVKVTVNTVYAGGGGDTGGGDTSGGGKGGDEDTGQTTWTTTTTTTSEKTKVYVVTYSGLEAPYYFKYKDDANTAANWLKHTAGGDHDDAHSQEMTKEEVMKQDPSAQLCRFTYERNGSIAGIERKNQFVSSLDTGGYTGVWGDQGRLAMLHEKELVLNKEDTTNLLEAIDIMRKLDLGQIETRMYESFLLAQQRMAEDRVAPDTQPTAINQTITINADFPDASDRDEIRAAFDSLVNMASQRAFTKRY